MTGMEGLQSIPLATALALRFFTECRDDWRQLDDSLFQLIYLEVSAAKRSELSMLR